MERARVRPFRSTSAVHHDGGGGGRSRKVGHRGQGQPCHSGAPCGRGARTRRSQHRRIGTAQLAAASENDSRGCQRELGGSLYTPVGPALCRLGGTGPLYFCVSGCSSAIHSAKRIQERTTCNGTPSRAGLRWCAGSARHLPSRTSWMWTRQRGRRTLLGKVARPGPQLQPPSRRPEPPHPVSYTHLTLPTICSV